MKPVCLLLPLLIAPALATGSRSAHGQSLRPRAIDSVAVEVVRGQPDAVDPGATVTTTFRIRNRGQSPVRLRTGLDLPAGWTSAATATDVHLEPAAATTQFVLVRVPEGAWPGEYSLGLSLTGVDGGMLAAHRSIHVRRNCRFALEADASNRFVEAGRTIDAAGRITNTGNIDLDVQLGARSGDGFVTGIDPSVVSVRAGSAVGFAAHVRTPATVIEREKRALILTAKASACPDVVQEDAVLFDVIPAADADERRHGLPAALTVNSTAAGSAVAAQLGVELGGYIDEAESRRIALAVQLPDRRRSSRFGQRSVLSALYESPGLAVHLGDTRFGYSTLTRVPGIGRGLSIEARQGSLTAGGFVERSRFGFPVRSRQGVLLGFQMSEWTSLGATYLRRDGLDRGETVTVYGNFTPSAAANLLVEVGDAVASTGRTAAVALEMKGRQANWAQYTGRVVHAGAGYPGQYANFDFRQGAITIRPAAGLSLYSSAKQERQRFASPSGSRTWFREDLYVRSGTGWRRQMGTIDTHLKLDLGGRERKTVTDSYHTQSERELKLTTTFGFGAMSVAGHVTTGHFDRAGAEEPTAYRQVGLSGEAHFGKHSVAVAVEHFDGARIEHPADGRSTAFRLGAVSRLGYRTRLQIDGLVSRDAYWGGLYQLIHTRLSRTFGRSEVTARFQYTSVGTTLDQSTTDVGISIRVPLFAPNPFRAPGRRVAGRVFDAETGEGIPGALVHLADSHVLTSAEGRFSVKDPGNGTHLLDLDVSTLDIDQVPLLQLPLPVGGESLARTDIEIPVSRSAELSGRLLIADPAGSLDPSNPSSEPPVALAVVEITDVLGAYRTVTNAAGRFIFPRIRPGEYRVSVVHAELPPHFRIEKVENGIRVPPGGSRSIEIRAVREGHRRIRIIGGGELGLEPNDAEHEAVESARQATPQRTNACGVEPAPAEDRMHRVSDGESLSLIALSHYGHPLLWPVIWERNRSIVSDPDLIPVGLEIAIPERRFEVRRTPGDRGNASIHPDETLRSVAERRLGLEELWPLLVARPVRATASDPASAFRIRYRALEVREISTPRCSE